MLSEITISNNNNIKNFHSKLKKNNKYIEIWIPYTLENFSELFYQKEIKRKFRFYVFKYSWKIIFYK